MLKILVIIPVFNEEATITEVIHSVTAHFPEADLLVVNDGSTDRTSSLVRQLHVNIIDLPVNLGIGGAVQTGFLYALYQQYDIAVQVDGDGQHNPVYLPQLVAPIRHGDADMVIGSRFLTGEGFQSTRLRKCGIKYFQRLIFWVTGRNITDPTSGFRAYHQKVLAIFAQYYPRDYPEPESVAVALRKGLRIMEVPVLMNARQGGMSSITLVQSLYYVMKVSLAIMIDRWKEV